MKKKTDSKAFRKQRAQTGGQARAKSLTKKQRQEIARKASRARWNNGSK